jgi:hypothetical protein
MGILAPSESDQSLQLLIEELRLKGECVIRLLPGQKSTAAAMNCDRQIQKIEDKWHVVEAK